MSRIPILVFVTDFRTGGTERQVANLVAGLDASRFAIHVACFREEGQFLDDVKERVVRLAPFRIRRLDRLSTVREQWRFAGYLKRHRIALVHSFGFYPNLFAAPAARFAGVPVVASIRDTGDHLDDWRRRAQRYACRLADVVLANARAVETHLLEQGYDRRRLRVIHNGIALDTLRATRPRQEVRAELGVPASAPLVAMTARFTPLKGIEYFLAAAAELSTRCPDLRFLLTGDSVCAGMGNPAYRRDLERQAVALGLAGRLQFTGFRSDMSDLLAATNVSVLPSLAEGLSNVVLEAMAAGVPVVATRVGGNAEMVVDGETGLLVPPRDSGALAHAISQLVTNDEQARRFGAAGRRRALAHFSIEAMVAKTTGVYAELLRLPADERAGVHPVGPVAEAPCFK